MTLTTLPAAASGGPGDGTALTKRYSPPAEHIKMATPEDIFYCFRLLLGSCPNPEEWPGHSFRVGEDLENIGSSYVTSREFAEPGLLNKTYRDQVEPAELEVAEMPCQTKGSNAQNRKVEPRSKFV